MKRIVSGICRLTPQGDLYDGHSVRAQSFTDYSVETSRAFARESQRLEELSVPHVIDAWRFFRACEPEWTWPNLKSLTLTCSVLSKGSSQEDNISNLVRIAGLAARNMPKLERMDIWKFWKREACWIVFRRESSRKGTIAIKATWDIELDPDVVEAWEGCFC